MAATDRSGFIVPIVLWGRNPPVNKVTHITVLARGKIIVTGGADGQLVQWTVDETLNWIQPELMLLAHSAPISCLTPISSKCSSKYISCSEDGQLCLWDSHGGRAQNSVTTRYVHRNIYPHESHGIIRLFCIGDYTDIVVLDPQDLRVLFFFRSRLDPDWMSALTMVVPNNKPVVIGISLAGMIKMWSLQDIDKRDTSAVIYEEEAKPLEIKDSKAICCSELNLRMMLIITPNSWQVLDPSTLQKLIVSQCAIEAVNGAIIDIDKIAVGFIDSTIVLFQLPRSRLCGRQIREKFGEKPALAGNLEYPFVFALLKGFPSPTTIPTLNVNFYFDHQYIDGNDKRTAYRVDEEGSLSIWTIPQNFDSLVDEFIRTRKPNVYEPTIKQKFADVWQKINLHPSALIGPEKDRKITSTLYVSSQGKLLLGCEDGSVIITYACHVVATRLLETPYPEAEYRELTGHNGAVNCFLYPHEDAQRYDPDVFLSGGSDFAVILWNLTSGTQIRRFCAQGGPVLRIVVPPESCNPRVLHCVCSISGDNSAALLSLKENKCILLASRQQYPIVDVHWRPMDDFMLLKCEDSSIYVWQMESGNLDRIVTGLMSVDVLSACDEQTECEDEAGASQAVQLFRAIKHKNVSAIKKVAAVGSDRSDKTTNDNQFGILDSPIDIVQLKKCSNDSHLVLFNVDALIAGIKKLDAASPEAEAMLEAKQSLSNLVSRKSDNFRQSHLPYQPNGTAAAAAQHWRTEAALFVDVARLLISLLHGWNMNETLDSLCISKLKLLRPRAPLSFGVVTRKGFVSLYLPYNAGRPTPLNDPSFTNFSKTIRWNIDSMLTTVHLLTLIAISNLMMSLKHRALQMAEPRAAALQRTSSVRSIDSGDPDTQGCREAFSHMASLHGVMLPDTIRSPNSYSPPDIDGLARRWQYSCLEIREAAQILLVHELKRMGINGRRSLIDRWTPFLPGFLDPSLSIFGAASAANLFNRTMAPNKLSATHLTFPNGGEDPNVTSNPPAPSRPPPPPVPPRHPGSHHPPLPQPKLPEPLATNSTAEEPKEKGNSHEVGGLQQIRRNQATAIILLGIFGAEFPDDIQDRSDLVRTISHSLVQLLLCEDTQIVPSHSALRRAAVDLIGRGFTLWQPHIDLTKVLLGLLELASFDPTTAVETPPTDEANGVGSAADSSAVARHALLLIASVRAQALLSALSMEVVRYNTAAQQQTVQHNLISPLLKSRAEILKLIEEMSDKQYNDVTEMIIPVGDILVHCLDSAQLKHRALSDVFPPISKFYMVGYCQSTRRIAVGGKNGSVVVHDLKASKSQTIQAHKAAITAVAFSQDGKYLAVYSSQDARISFWNSQPSLFGMGQSQIRCVKTLPAPSEFPVLSPGGSYQPFRARLVWINAKSLTLMLPNGKENRFAV